MGGVWKMRELEKRGRVLGGIILCHSDALSLRLLSGRIGGG